MFNDFDRKMQTNCVQKMDEFQKRAEQRILDIELKIEKCYENEMKIKVINENKKKCQNEVEEFLKKLDDHVNEVLNRHVSFQFVINIFVSEIHPLERKILIFIYHNIFSFQKKMKNTSVVKKNLKKIYYLH